ncbi:HAMP domain-containing sensor histidine kinase [Sediminibacillus halophilus]|uniref:histidine kinase n=1 Tax=Sediminibacillus halophilus TaxID=482461 RepID=A0A1G9NK48_9BACI|nr:HAMP domain-containing sensor histidine kinase [Sediminibacillus halophilus]SDL86972.1 Signal transduction histidine kinase [Sediminibacillus halophilus]
MRIKTWLALSYLIVLLLPFAAVYGLYISISHFDRRQDLREFVAARQQMEELETILQEEKLYHIQPRENYQEIEKAATGSIRITLYRPDGITLYSSWDDSYAGRLLQVDTSRLYSGLNHLSKHARTYSLKQTVFHDRELTGIYEITLPRDVWIDGVNNRTIMVGGILGLFVVLVYGTVIWLLHRKLTRPLGQLRENMMAFANGEPLNDQWNHSRDEIGELIAHFYQMKKQIERTRQELVQQQQEKQFIVAALSHDLKTPLTVIQAYSESLWGGRLLSEEERLEYAEILFNKIAYMKQLLQDLSLYTSLQSEEKEAEQVLVDGEEFFDMLLNGYEEPCTQNKIKLHTEVCAANTYCLNPGQMMRVVDNVMSNSIRHTPPGKNLWLAVVSSDCPLPEWVFHPFHRELESFWKGGTLLLIQNHGKAIPKELQERIFLPFVQGEDARANGSSGLGLSIAKKIIEQHGGKIGLWSEDGYGTLIACWLREGEQKDEA